MGTPVATNIAPTATVASRPMTGAHKANVNTTPTTTISHAYPSARPVDSIRWITQA